MSSPLVSDIQVLGLSPLLGSANPYRQHQLEKKIGERYSYVEEATLVTTVIKLANITVSVLPKTRPNARRNEHGH